MADSSSDDPTTRAIAHLPGLDIEIEHRQSEHAERISIHLQAMPSFEAFGRFVESGNPFALWMQAAQMWTPLFFPWLNMTRALTPPSAPPTVPEA